MPLNAKVAAEIDRQVSTGVMTQDYAAQLKGTLENAHDSFQAGFLAGPDYQRNQQRLKAEQDAFESQKTEWKTWKATADQEYNDALAKAADLQAKLDAGGGTVPQQVDLQKQIDQAIAAAVKAQGFVTKSEYEKELEQTKRDGLGLMGNVIDQQRRIESQYMKDFNKPFDPLGHSELVTLANELATKEGRYVPLEDAYKAKYGEDIEKQKQERWMLEGEKRAEEKYAREHVPGAGGNGMAGGGSQAGPLMQRMQQLQGKDFTSTDGDLQSAKASAVEALRAAR